ncbi:MAG TPA: NHL domain-containing thioredoxin family protein [Longimicrobiales bacterium]
MNCLHELPQLRKLEAWFPAELVVVGVHSGKFIAERDTANIREAVLRHGIDHPVVNDRQFRIWRSYAVNAWPTLVLVDPEGRVVGQQAGELPAERLAEVIRRVVADAESAGTLDRAPRTFRPEWELEPDRMLRHPAKVRVDAASGRLFLADTGHHRVLVVRIDADGRGGALEAVIGGGAAGLEDGPFEAAAFRNPHGLALAGDTLYVADTENHAIRSVDLARGRVAVLAGTGEQARPFNPGGRGRDVALNSPWDVLVQDGALYVAMAGPHQIWRLDPTTGGAAPWAGTGAEALVDGPRGEAALAQPSGLATDGRRLYFADAEDSAIRWAELGAAGAVHTIVGTGLFDFGDRDGAGDEVRLQHPLGVAWHDGVVFVADTYNGKIKRVDPATRACNTVPIAEGELWEPGGLDVAGGRIYVADTNHHRVAVVDPAGGPVETFEIRGA